MESTTAEVESVQEAKPVLFGGKEKRRGREGQVKPTALLKALRKVSSTDKVDDADGEEFSADNGSEAGFIFRPASTGGG
jgi:3-dehydroquinate dehydratase